MDNEKKKGKRGEGGMTEMDRGERSRLGEERRNHNAGASRSKT